MQTVIKNLNWRRGNATTLVRCFTLASVLACIAAIDLVSGLAFVLPTNQTAEELKSLPLHGSNTAASYNRVSVNGAKNKSKDVCLSAECKDTASLVLSKMKPEIDPCDDFYQFTCGNYIDKTEIPEDKVAVDVFTVIFDKLQEQLKEIITEERPETDPKHFRLPNALYKACMNESLIESLGTKPIKEISDSLGGWPVIVGSSWNSDGSWTWQETVKKFARLGFSTGYIVAFSIEEDLENSTKRIIKLDQSMTGLSREYLIKGFNETVVLAYYDYMVDTAVLFHAEKEAAKRELRASLEFEMALAKFSWSNEKRRNPNDLNNLRTIKQLQESYPCVQWLSYIKSHLPDDLYVDENEIVNLSVPSFFDELCNLLNSTDERVIANYMYWGIYKLAVSFLPKEFRNRQLAYNSALFGIQKQEARWKECVNMVWNTLEISVGSLYVRKHFKQDSKAIAMEMVNNIRNVFSKILDDVKWMDGKTRQEAKKKFNSMTTHIGYPDEMLDNDKLEEYYRKLEINPEKYFQSFLNVIVFNRAYFFNKLRLPVNKTDWVKYANPAMIDAEYSSIENSIQFPAGILQGHFFGAQRQKYMNYGTIGWVIGHEITHGFDDQGRQFDFEGNLFDWWQPATLNAYLEKAKCIIEQYGNYTDKQTGLNLNGINTQSENIADNGGIKESYLAYNQWVAENGEELKLPGLNYTSQQMFWISAAQTWCSKYRKETIKLRITTGVHSTDEFRVLGSLRNMKDFSRDFQCPEGSPMNPVKKCEVW